MRLLKLMMGRYLAFLLHDGRLQPHPYEVQTGGLCGVEVGVQRLYDGKVSAKKLVYRYFSTLLLRIYFLVLLMTFYCRISDTPHLDDYN